MRKILLLFFCTLFLNHAFAQETCETALVASSGTNTLPTTENSDYWYEYTATQDGKIQINSADNNGIEIYSGADCSSLSFEISGYNNVTFFESVNGETYRIKWNVYSGGDFDWTLTESAILPGDDCNNRVIASAGTNAVPSTINQWYWYEYTATKDGKIEINSSNGNNVTLYSGADCSSFSYEAGGYESFTFYEAVNGETYYIQWVVSGGDFEWTLTELDLFPGDYCGNAIVASLGTNTLPSTANNEYWYEYTATQDGKIQINSADNNDINIYSGSDCLSLNYLKYGHNNALITNAVNAETYYFQWFLYSGGDFEWSLIESAPETGDDCEYAAVALSGANTMPATINNEYWYKYTATQDGNILINSSDGNGIDILYGSSCSSLNYKDGGFNNVLITEVVNGETYYIKWNIYHDGDSEWTLTETPVLPGDFCNNAAAANAGINSLPATLNSEYWYQYTATQDGKIQINSTDNNDINIYSGADCSSLNYEKHGRNNVLITNAVNGETYYFQWFLYSGGDFEWTLTEADVEPGDDCEYAAVALSGTNTLPATLNYEYWYKYTATQDGKIQINSSNDNFIYVYSGADCSSISLEKTGLNNVTLAEVITGETYFLRWNVYSVGNFDWTLTESDLLPGDYCGNAIAASPGTNSLPVNSSDEYWYEYTATQDGIIQINSHHLNDVYIYSGTDCSSLSIEDSGLVTARFEGAVSGETYYIAWYLRNDGGFDWTLTEGTVTPEADCENAAPASSGINTIPPTVNDRYWYEYTATQDGKIQINSSDSNAIYIYSGTDCSSLNFEISGNNNVTFENAISGETYYIEWCIFSAGGFDWTLSEVAYIPGENCENAVAASSGTNTFPLTENSDYWYKYTATQDGKIEINSSDGKAIDIYSGIDCSSLSYEISGYRNATFTKAINGETYHIKWGDSPEGNFDWTLTESAVDPGEDCDNAIIASSGINLLPVTSNEYYWYEYTATQDGKIQINSSDDNYIYIYSGINCSSLSYETDGYNNATFTEAVNGETYFIRWSVYSGGDFNWTLTESAIAPGDNCENAITASAGTNTLPLTENRDYWYKYTATQDGKIQINSSNGKGIDIYSGIDCSSLSYEVAGYRNVTFTKAINGETYYIKWGDYPEGNFDWTLTESTIEPGDDCENAIVASSGINTVTNTLNSEIWYKYTATQDGKILINSSDDNNLTLYSGSDCSSLSYQVNGYNNITFNEAINGEVYYIRWFLHTGGGFDWTLTESIAGPGDSCAEPVQAVLGDNNSAYAKYWFEFTVPSSSNYTISSVGTATNDTYLKVYSDCAGTLIDENDDYSGLQSQLTLNLSEGEVIYILWDDVFSSLGFDWTITSDAALIDQTITFNTLNTKTYGDNDFDLTATASSGLAITYSSSNESVATINGQTVTILGAGTTTITASQSGNESFNPAPDVEQVLTIDKADQNITFSLVSDKTFGDADFDLTATTSSGLAVSYLSSNTSVATISGNTVTIVGAGTTTITASQSGNDNYHAAADVERTFTVGKANQTLTFDIADQEIGNAPFSISASSNSGLTNFTFTVIDGPASVSGSTLTLDGTEGSVEVKAMEVGNDNYNTASISTTFQVKDPSKTDQTITFSSLSNKTFGDADFELTATASSGLEVIYTSSNPEVATVNGSTVTVVGAGSTTITASQGGDANFNIATPVSQVLIVNKATQTITVELIADKAVNSSPFELVASTTSGLDLTYFVSGPATIEGNTITLDGAAGMVTVTVLQAGNENYTSAEAQVSFEVLDNLTAQTIMFESIKDQFLIDESLSLTATASSGLDVTYEIVSGPAKVNGNVVTFTGLGSVTVKASQQGNSEYLPAEPAEQSFDILQTIQSITFDNIDDQLFSNSTLELSATASSGLDVAYEILSGPAAVSGDIITFTGLGEVTVSASQAGSDAFAPATSVEQSFTIFKKEQTITFNTIDDQFFEAGSLNLSATASSGLEVSHDIVSGPATVSGNVVSFSDLGTVVVSANQAGNDSFLAAVSVEQSFDVITVTGVDGETSSLLIYPNPASNVLTIRTQQENAVIELLNLNGLVVMDIRPNAENNISHLSNGVYFLRISAGADYGVHKIIKK